MESKDKLIAKEQKRLKKLFTDSPENLKSTIEGLIQNAAYMKTTLAELQTIVNTEGVMITITNGNGFDILQEHPASKAYTALISKYSAVITKLSQFLPEEKKAESKLSEFFSAE